ncbi:hypothetical protein EJB05_26568, partial [Eragrostis curvula]
MLVFAGKSVATPVISFIVNKAFSYLSKWQQAEGMEAVKDRMLQRLAEIQAAYAAVDHGQIDTQSSSALDQWLWRFRDAIEGAEDVLDEIEYNKLEKEAQDRNLQAQLMKAMEDLDGVAAGVCTFLNLIRSADGHALEEQAETRDQQTSSALVTTEIYGLLSSSDKEKGQVPVFAIIGIGGIGKTTLAQVVCKELEDSRHFDQLVWTHVSDDTFSATRITKKILEVVLNEKPNANTLEAMQNTLRETLKRKKFLLVLDDVWEDSKRNLILYLLIGGSF